MRRRLEEVPVDREPVVCVALRLRPHGGPFGQETGDQVLLIERLERRDRGPAGQEHPDQRLSGLERPWVRRRGHAVCKSVQRRLSDGEIAFGGEAKGQRRIVDDGGVARQRNFAAHDLDAWLDLLRLGRNRLA